MIEFTDEADIDISEILDFTLQRFGSEQRLIYKQWLNQAIQRIANDPSLGKTTEKLPLKRYHMSWAGNRGVHCICDCGSGNTLSIARVLHQSSDHNSILT